MCYAASISQLEYLRASWMKIYSQSYLQYLVKTWFENLSQFDIHQCKYHNSLLNNSYPNSLIIAFQMENSHKKYRKRKQHTHIHTHSTCTHAILSYSGVTPSDCWPCFLLFGVIFPRQFHLSPGGVWLCGMV